MINLTNSSFPPEDGMLFDSSKQKWIHASEVHRWKILLHTLAPLIMSAIVLVIAHMIN
jgi:hypothetical protein